jgi:hypothetical protein
MNRLEKFFGLPTARRRLLIRAFLAAGAVNVGLRVFSLPRLQALIAKKRSRSTESSEGEICWAAAVAARYTPGAACLVEALTAHYLLIRGGYGSRLRIGVRPEGGGIAAHAWVELEGNAHSADFGVSYTVLPL